MALDERPCKGDAYHPLQIPLDFTCMGCRDSDENGGKCAGANRWYFSLCLLGPLREYLDEHPEIDRQERGKG